MVVRAIRGHGPFIAKHTSMILAPWGWITWTSSSFVFWCTGIWFQEAPLTMFETNRWLYVVWENAELPSLSRLIWRPNITIGNCSNHFCTWHLRVALRVRWLLSMRPFAFGLQAVVRIWCIPSSSEQNCVPRTVVSDNGELNRATKLFRKALTT